MDQYADARNSPEYRKWASRSIQFAGLTDVAIGIAVALYGPGFIGGDPVVDLTLMITGGALAAGGVGIWWWARYRFGTGRSIKGADSAVGAAVWNDEADPPAGNDPSI